MTDRVVMCLRGRMLEKFVGRALEEGVRFEEIRRSASCELCLAATERDAARLAALAEEYGMDLSVVRKEGWPVLKQKRGALGARGAGFVLGLCLLLMFASHIWRVEARSLDGLADTDLLRAVERTAAAYGARPGARRGNVDREALALAIQARWPEFRYVAVRSTGVFLRVDVAMEDPAPPVYDLADRRDLLAARDAVVVRVETLAGKAAVKEGDTVRRGQVLIRGEERADAGNTRGVRALGEVVGRVWFQAECRLPTEKLLTGRTGARRVSAVLRLGAWQWPLSPAEDYPCQEVETETLPVGGLYLPVRVVRRTLYEARERIVPQDPVNLTAQAEDEALRLARLSLPEGARETGRWVDFEETNGTLTARATVEAQMDIAVPRTE